MLHVAASELDLHCKHMSPKLGIRIRSYKTFFMLNSTEHEILNAYKYKNTKKSAFSKLRQDYNAIFPAHKC